MNHIVETKRHVKTMCLAAALLLNAAGAAAQHALPPVVRRAADRINAAQLERDLNYIAADALRGRDTFSPGFDSAANYIVARLKRAGVEPFGDNGTFFQHYDVVRTRIDTAQAYVELGGKRFAFPDVLFAGRSQSVSATAPVVYVGHGHRIPSKGIDAYAGIDIKNKILLVHAGARPKGFTAENMPSDARNALQVAATAGASGILTIPLARQLERWHLLKQAPFVRTHENLEPDVPSAFSVGTGTTFIYLKPEPLAALLAGERIAADALRARADSGDFVPSFELSKPATIHVAVSAREKLTSYNVVARIPGSDPTLRNQYVTVAAHLDGAVDTEPIEGDSIYNAADDNASGSAGLLAIAEQMAAIPRPRRSLVFIWDSGEEVGLYGTRSFVGKKVVAPKDIVAHFNLDMIGATRAPATVDSASAEVAAPNEVYIIGPRVLSASMDSLIRQTNRTHVNMRLNFKYDHENNPFFYPRTDAGPFLERGVLTVDFFTGLHARYHMPQDEARHLDRKKMEAVSRTVFGVLWSVANVPQAPTIDKTIPARVPRYDN